MINSETPEKTLAQERPRSSPPLARPQSEPARWYPVQAGGGAPTTGRSSRGTRAWGSPPPPPGDAGGSERTLVGEGGGGAASAGAVGKVALEYPLRVTEEEATGVVTTAAAVDLSQEAVGREEEEYRDMV